jgi:hypothetical protein
VDAWSEITDVVELDVQVALVADHLKGFGQLKKQLQKSANDPKSYRARLVRQAQKSANDQAAQAHFIYNACFLPFRNRDNINPNFHPHRDFVPTVSCHFIPSLILGNSPKDSFPRWACSLRRLSVTF